MLNEQQMAVTMLLRERTRQEQKWGPQVHSPLRWMNILDEEKGECSDVINDVLESEHLEVASDTLVGNVHLLHEVTQVAAVALAWMEQLLRERRGKDAKGLAGSDAGQTRTGG